MMITQKIMAAYKKSTTTHKLTQPRERNVFIERETRHSL